MMTSPPSTIEHLHAFATPTLVPPTVLSSARAQSESSSRGTNRGRTSELPPVRETMAAPLVVITTAENTTLVERTIHPNVPTSSTNTREYEILSPEIASAQAEMLMCKSKIVLNKRRREEEMRRMIEEQEVEQKRVQDERRAVRQGYDETIRQFKENQVSLGRQR
jgi:hypothetical protein